MINKFLTILIILISLSSLGQVKFEIKCESDKTHKEIFSIMDSEFISKDRKIIGDTLVFNTIETISNDFLIELLNNNNVIITYIKSNKSIPFSDKNGGVNCNLAQQLCSNTSVSGNNSGFGTQELNSSNRGCLLGNEHQSSWYYLNIQSGGVLNLNIVPNSNSDYDFAIWGPFNTSNINSNCPPITTPIRCDFLFTSGSTGLNTPTSPGYQNSINTNSGDIYILLVDNFSATSVGYNINFNNSTTVLGCTPISLNESSLIYFRSEIFDEYNLITWSFNENVYGEDIILEWTNDLNYNNWKILNKINCESGTYIISHDDFSKGLNNYYRLKIKDYNGNETIYSQIVVNNVVFEELYGIYDLLGNEVNEFYSGVVIKKYISGKVVRIIK